VAIVSFLFVVVPVVGAEKPAATVNGQPIPASAVERALKRLSDKAERDKARPEIVDFLIDNALIDQYLVQQKITVDKKELDSRMAEIKKEIEKSNQTFTKVLASLEMSEAEFSEQVVADLRWEKFAATQATDKNLKALFDQGPEMFDGSMVRARHILLTPKANDAKAADAARSQLLEFRHVVEVKAAAAVAKLPKTVDNLTREQERQKQLELAFAEIAHDKSVCPSSKEGGLLPWFPRSGSMVEPFAKAAFALKPFEMSQPVQTQFGYHLILCTGRKAGQAVKFEAVKDEVREVYCNRLREYLISQLRKTARIEIADAK
jgi:parvulin-like peptidyl-prolyl isomerase